MSLIKSNNLKHNIILILLIIILLFIAFPKSDVLARWQQEWSSYETENFVIFFPDSYEYQARELLFYLEEYVDEIVELTGKEIEDKIYLNLEDMGLLPNGFADPINKRMAIFAGNPDTRSRLAHYESWLRMVGIHELTHILHLTSSSGYSDFTTGIFGNALAPNLHSPLWLIEGIAVYAESQISPHEGRLNSGYYDGVLAQKAGKGNIPDLSDITYNHFHFPAGHRYLYGSTFIRYLSEEYGEDKFAEFFNEYGSYFWAAGPANLFPRIGPDRAAEKVYGSDLESLYNEWRKQEEKSSQDWQVDGEIVKTHEHSELRNLMVHEGRIYYLKFQRYPSSPFSYHGINKIMRYDPSIDKSEKIMETAAGLSGSIQIDGNKIYYLQRNRVKNYQNLSHSGAGVETRLIAHDIASGEKEKLIQAPIRDFLVLAEREKIIYARERKNEYGTKIMKLDSRRNEEKVGDFNHLVSELNHYGDNKVLLTAKEKARSWGIYKLDLTSAELISVFNTSWPEMHASRYKGKIIYTSNYDGYRGIYGYDINDQNKLKLTRGGYGKEGSVLGNNLFYLTYEGEGMALARKPLKAETLDKPFDEVERQRDEPQAELQNLDFVEKNFWSQNLKQLFPPTLRFPPIFLGGQDAAGMNSYALNLNPYGSLDAYFQSRVFQPLNIMFITRGGENERENRVKADYPLYRSSPDGLTDILLSGETDFTGVFLSSSIRWRYPRHLINLKLQTDILTGDFQGDINYSYLRDAGRIKLGGKYTAGIQLSEKPRLPTSSGKEGYYASAEYLTRLFSTGWGRWNPNIFVGDVYGRLFFDYLSLQERQFSGGLKIEVEIGTANVFHLTPNLGITRTRDSWQPFVGLGVTF